MRPRDRAPDLAIRRSRMVLREVVGRGITDERVIAAVAAVPRHRFVDEALAYRAYDGEALPIGARQTISRVHTVALMSELLAAEPGHRVLEVGTGSGYQAAVLAHLVEGVESVERLPILARRARRVLQSLGLANVRVWESDGTLGLPAEAPFPRIIVTAAAPGLPEALFVQLEERGRMVVPVADAARGERLQVVERVAGRRIVRRSVECSFVPLIGADGYAEPGAVEDPWLR
jgi:protein-L-isoaspartate(D-aspartate) O-methyltransferase